MTKLPLKPRILYISEVNIAPYEYIFSKFPGAFLRLGCELNELDPHSATFEIYRDTLQSFKPDIVFCLLRYPWAVRKISDFLAQYHPIVSINYFQDDPNFITADLIDASRRFDFWFTQDPRTVPYWPTKAFFCPHSFDEAVYYDRNFKREFDVSYIGQLGHELSTKMYWPYMQELARYGKKAFLALERPVSLPLLSYQMERVIRSPKLRPIWQRLPFWPHIWKNPRDEEDKALYINRSKIHFGINRVRGHWEESVRSLLPGYPFDKHGLFCQTKGRLFQGAACGAMVLNDHVPELEEFFEIGKEIVTFEFDNFKDLKEKLSWYIRHDSEREKIATAGYERAHKQHTFQARIQQIFDTVRRYA